MASLTFQNIRKSYGEVPVIHGIDLDVQDGEFMVFVGPSGCGKSTLLRMIAGLEDIDGGDLHIGGERVNDIAPARRGAAMVFQSYALYPHMSVADNMGFALKLAGRPKAEVAGAVRRAAEALQLTHLLDRKPKALSGGQRQRVAIGRAIVRTPKVFLFDEPLSNLDASLRVQMRVELARLHRELGSTMVYVTHDQVEAMTLGHRIAVFNSGRIEQVGAPMDLYDRPANLFVAGFLGSPRMNLLPVTVASVHTGGVRVDTGGVAVDVACDPRGAVPGAPGTLGFRPDHVRLAAPAEGGLNGRVDLVERLGDATLVHVSCASQAAPFIVRLPGHTVPLTAGEAVSLVADAHRVCLFEENGRAYAAAPGGEPPRAA
jgi:multiple sugar transport system ATP-binding protein